MEGILATIWILLGHQAIMAGMLGGAVHAIVKKNVKLIRGIALVLVGGITAYYFMPLLPLIAPFFAEPALYGSLSFLVGVLSSYIIQYLIEKGQNQDFKSLLNFNKNKENGNQGN